MNSYCVELIGILAVLVLLKVLQSGLPQKSMSAQMYCDKKAAVKKIKEVLIDYKYPYLIKTANQDELDMLSSI